MTVYENRGIAASSCENLKKGYKIKKRKYTQITPKNSCYKI